MAEQSYPEAISCDAILELCSVFQGDLVDGNLASGSHLGCSLFQEEPSCIPKAEGLTFTGKEEWREVFGDGEKYNIFFVSYKEFLICFLSHLSTTLIPLYSSLPELKKKKKKKLKVEIAGAGSPTVHNFVAFCGREIL